MPQTKLREARGTNESAEWDDENPKWEESQRRKERKICGEVVKKGSAMPIASINAKASDSAPQIDAILPLPFFTNLSFFSPYRLETPKTSNGVIFFSIYRANVVHPDKERPDFPFSPPKSFYKKYEPAPTL